MAEIFKLRTLSLWNGSALEHDIWEELINTETISTVKSLQLANERGIPVYTITPQNASIYLSQLKLGDKNTAIADEFNKEGASRVIVARDLTVLQKWTGTGWFTERADGSIGARISGTVVAGGGQAASAPTTLGTDTPKGAITAQSTAGDPVNIANGNYTHDEQDISLPGAGFGLQFNRHYDSQSSSDLGMGRGWTFSYGDKLTIAADGALTWITDQGYKLTFKSNGSGGYINPDRYFGSFSKDATGYSYREVDGFVHRFDLSGKLVLLTDRNSNQVSFSYDSNGHLSAVTDVDAPSRKLTFTWTGNLLTAVTDFGGRSWGFAYTNNLLTAVNRPTNVNTPASAIHYSYYNDTARNGWIQSITAADGGVTRFEYYTNGRVFRVTDALGEVQTFYYSLYHQQTEFVNERGEVTTYSYDKSGRMVGLENPDHTSESFTYVNGLLTAKTDEFGTPTTYVYDNRGNIVRTVDKAGIETTNTYDTTYNQITSQTRTADGQTTRYQYDSRGNLIRIQDALGNITTMSYDSRGLMTSRTAPNGNATATVGDYTTTYTYNNAGQVLTEANDLPATVSHGYDSLGREISRTDANGNTTTIAYDLLSRVVNIIDPLNHATQRRYDAAGNLIAVTDALGQTTGFSYDLKQRQVAAIAADGTEVHYAYDAVGNRIQATDALGRLTHYLYDDRNRLVETVAPDGARQSIDYDGGSRLIAQTDALGNTSSVSYDKAGRVIKTTDALGHNASSAYDNVGRLSTSTDRRGAVTRYSYDGLDRVIRTEEPGGQITTRSFDANGNTVSLGQYDILGLGSVPTNLSTLDSARQRISQIHYDVANRAVESIDPLGQANVTQYDAGGRVIRQTDSRGSVTSFQYDAAGNLVRRTAADSGVTQYSYDALNRQTSNTMPGGGVWQTGYDKLGHTTSQTDPQNKTTNYGYDAVGNQTRQQNADGSAIVNSYDLRNRIVSVNRSNGSDDVYNFDLAGNLTRASNADSETLFTYDTLNRRISESETLNDGYNLNLSYSYDAEGHLLSQAQTGPWTRTLNYQYDLAGRMTQASSSDGLSANVTYNGFGERTQINLGNGVIENTSFDKAGRVSQISYTTAGNNHSSLTYLRDAGGLPTQVSENLNGVLATLNLTQDAMGRVTAVTGNTNRSENFSYDLNGNLYGDANVTTPSGTTAGLAGYWSGNGNVTDSSTNNNSGSFNGTYVDNGKGALAFNLSSGIVSIPDNPAYSFGDSFTISFAFNVNGTNGKGVYIGQDEGGGSFPKWFIDYGYQGNYFEFHTNDVNNQSAFIP